MHSFKVHYNTVSTELCELGKKYDTDKSSQRAGRSDIRHCHPYTIFYDSLFRSHRNEPLNIAELGILEGSSLRMWREYFPNANIVGFDNNVEFIDNYKNNFEMDKTTLLHMDVFNQDSISNGFHDAGKEYDIIIEDTTHQFQDQIRVIFQAYKHLKPGGIIIIEDIFRSYKEEDYLQALRPIMNNFQDYYFIDLDHENRISTGWDNDKLFVLVKNGGEPIFKKQNRMTIITPSCRVQNLIAIKNSVDFNYVDEWIIVYDGKRVFEIPDFLNNHPHKNKIKQYIFSGDGISGNPQRNFALTQVSNWNTFIYFLDDDNLVHPYLYRLLDIFDNGYIYTFNQENHEHHTGNNVKVAKIDTAMFLVDGNLCKGEEWEKERYDADGYYIVKLHNKHSKKHIWINNSLCYYNLLR